MKQASISTLPLFEYIRYIEVLHFRMSVPKYGLPICQVSPLQSVREAEIQIFGDVSGDCFSCVIVALFPVDALKVFLKVFKWW